MTDSKKPAETAVLGRGSAPPTSFSDIMRLIPHLPSLPDSQGGGDWADAAEWLGIVQQRQPAQLLRPKLALLAARHGDKVPADDLLTPYQNGQAPLIAEASAIGSELQIYDLRDAPVGDSGQGPALTETEAAHAMAYGMTVAGQGYDLLALSTLGDEETGANSSAAAVIAALLKNEPDDAGAKAAIAANRAALTDPLTIAATLGGHDICAMVGAMLAARLAHLPTIVEGRPAVAAALVLAMLDRDLTLHIRSTTQIDVYPQSLLKVLPKIGAIYEHEPVASLQRLCLALQR